MPENRIYRDLDFLFSPRQISTTSYTFRRLAAGSYLFRLEPFVVPEQINVLTPIGVSDPNAAIRYPLLPTTKGFGRGLWRLYLHGNAKVFLPV